MDLTGICLRHNYRLWLAVGNHHRNLTTFTCSNVTVLSSFPPSSAGATAVVLSSSGAAVVGLSSSVDMIGRYGR